MKQRGPQCDPPRTSPRRRDGSPPRDGRGDLPGRRRRSRSATPPGNSSRTAGPRSTATGLSATGLSHPPDSGATEVTPGGSTRRGVSRLSPAGADPALRSRSGPVRGHPTTADRPVSASRPLHSSRLRWATSGVRWLRRLVRSGRVSAGTSTALVIGLDEPGLARVRAELEPAGFSVVADGHAGRLADLRVSRRHPGGRRRRRRVDLARAAGRAAHGAGRYRRGAAHPGPAVPLGDRRAEQPPPQPRGPHRLPPRRADRRLPDRPGAGAPAPGGDRAAPSGPAPHRGDGDARRGHRRDRRSRLVRRGARGCHARAAPRDPLRHGRHPDRAGGLGRHPPPALPGGVRRKSAARGARSLPGGVPLRHRPLARRGSADREPDRPAAPDRGPGHAPADHDAGASGLQRQPDRPHVHLLAVARPGVDRGAARALSPGQPHRRRADAAQVAPGRRAAAAGHDGRVDGRRPDPDRPAQRPGAHQPGGAAPARHRGRAAGDPAVPQADARLLPVRSGRHRRRGGRPPARGGAGQGQGPALDGLAGARRQRQARGRGGGAARLHRGQGAGPAPGRVRVGGVARAALAAHHHHRRARHRAVRVRRPPVRQAAALRRAGPRLLHQAQPDRRRLPRRGPLRARPHRHEPHADPARRARPRGGRALPRPGPGRARSAC